jgi:predicted DNA-binding transcriptional regulator YafY
MGFKEKIEDFKNINFNEENEYEEEIIKICSSFKNIKQIMEDLNIDTDIESFQLILDQMVSYDLLLLKYPDDIEHPKQKYKYNKPAKDETKQTRRVLELINKFNRGEKVSIEKLISDAQDAHNNNGSEIDLLWFNPKGGNRKDEQPGPISEKTIRRDLDIIKHHFPKAFELISGEKGCYKALTKNVFDNFLNPEALSLMIQTFNIAQRSNMFDSFDISEEDKKILNKKAQEKSKVYEFKNRPFEHIEKDLNYFHIIEKNIKEKKSIIFKYEQNNEIVKDVLLNPYKILFMNDNFHVALLGHHVRQQRVAGDVEGHPKEGVRAALV